MSESAGIDITPRDRIKELGAEIIADVNGFFDSICEGDDLNGLSQLDADISFIENHVAVQLRIRRNSRVAFLRLPPEIICRIALLLAEEWRPCMPLKESSELQVEDLGWINISSVCSSLRSLVLNHCQLWADDAFTLPNVRFSKQMISRAGGFPLTANLMNINQRVNTKKADFDASMSLLREHLASVHRVYISQERGRGLNKGLTLFTCNQLSTIHLPYLKSLVMKITDPQPGPATDRYTDDPPMLTPNLRLVLLSNAYVPFDSSTLTELDLSTGFRYDRSPEWIPPVRRFLDILRNARNLRFLKLRAIIPELEGAGALLTQISLPHLQVLSMQDEAHKCLALWSLLVIPPHATVCLRLYAAQSGVSSEDPIAQLSCLRALVAPATSASFVHTSHLKLVIFTPAPKGGYTSNYPNYTKQNLLNFKHHLIRLDLKFEGLSPSVSFAATTLSHCAVVMGLDHVRTLQIENRVHQYASEDWRLVLEPFKGTKSLDVVTVEDQLNYDKRRTQVDHGGVVKALLENPHNVLPDLKSLRMQAVRIHADCSTEMLRSLAHSRSLQYLHVGLLVFDKEYELCDAKRWEEERHPFISQMEAFGTRAEGFVAEPDDDAVDDQQRQSRERVLLWQQRLATA